MKVSGMKTTLRNRSGAREGSIRCSKIVCLLLVLLYVPFCTAENMDLPDAPMPAGGSAAALPQMNAPMQQTKPDSVPANEQGNTSQGTQVPNGARQTDKQAAQTTGQNGTSGVAAAPYINPEAVTGSQPAGAAIAPAKQRRRRIFALRLGLIIGAAIAVGTVVALSEGSPSRSN